MLSRPLDPQWTTELPSLVNFLNGLCETLTVAENRKRKRAKVAQYNFESAVKAIVLDLCRAYLSNPVIHVGISSGQSALHLKAASRYGSTLYSPRTFRAAVQALINQGFIVRTAPYWDDPSGKNSRTARYQASSSLILALHHAGMSLTALSRKKDAESIRLKGADKRYLEYGDVSFANEARDRLYMINTMLEDHWADFSLSDHQLCDELVLAEVKEDSQAAMPFDFSARTVYRVFNNGDWEQGGRFYGAWWMACPSRSRRYILIDGKRTVEVDYSGLHAAMLFAEANISIPDDPYSRCLSQAGNNNERKLVKRTFNALLNAKSIKALSKIDGFSEQLTGCDWETFKRHIVNCYPELKSHFGSGVGLRLQRKDSDLAEKVMLKFARMGYACLPVHDSFLVHHALQGELTDAMQEAFESEFKAVGRVSFEIGLGEPVEPTGSPIEMDIGDLRNQPSYLTRLQEFWKTRCGQNDERASLDVTY